MTPRTPELLHWLTETTRDGTLPIKEILSDCTYYPASGTDGIILSQAWRRTQAYSFVYADYGVSKCSLENEIERQIPRGGQGLLGYRLVFRRSVARHELEVPGWVSRVPLTSEERRRALEIYRHVARDHGTFRLASVAYCEWAVFEREESRDASHGPARLSLLFLFADGVAAYDALFLSRGISPGTLVVKQPGHAFGKNWSNFFEIEGPLYRAVHAQSMKPRHLIFGGADTADRYREFIWPGYKSVDVKRLSDGSLVFASRASDKASARADLNVD